MAKQLPCIDARCRDFIGRQRIFFAASAAPGAHINLSPRGADAFAVLDDMTVAYVDLTGSGNETAAHLRADGRLTLMFCAFDGPPNRARFCGAEAHPIARFRPARSEARSRPARARSFASMSTASRRPAHMGFRCSTIAASVLRWR